jgi:catechol 2,3-dioxygenase
MMINVTNVGHVVLKVRDLERSVRFYRDVLGLKEVARGTFGRPMAFFSATGENHHDIGLFEVGPDAAPPEKNHVGLYHVALRIGHSLEELRAAKAHLEANGVQELRLRDHTVSQSVYLNDPDGNGLELYVDADPGIWRDDPAAVATSVPLEL